MEIFLYLFFCWAITNIIVNGTILEPIRNYLLLKARVFGKLFTCIMCSGFWVGILMYNFFPFPNGFIFEDAIRNWIAFGFFSSGFSVIINSLIVYFLKK